MSVWIDKKKMNSRNLVLDNRAIFVSSSEYLNEYRNTEKRRRSKGIHAVLKPVLITAQFIAVLPLYGVFSSDETKVKFVAKSLKTVLSILMICVSCFMTAVTILTSRQGGAITYNRLTSIIFYASSTLSMIFLFRLAISWKQIMKEWTDVDDYMIDLKPSNAAIRIKILVLMIIFMSISEHVLSRMHLFNKNLFHWRPISNAIVDLLITMTWNFTDLLLMTISIALSSKFEQLNKELESVRNKEKSIEYWRKTRIIYNKLAHLTKSLDEKLSPTILISFANNLYFICNQLLNSMKPMQSVPKAIYFFLSFGHLLFRTSAVCLTASSIYDNSKQPLSSLFSVTSNTYNTEVQRFVAQVTFDTLAFTGCKFFTITRNLVLTIAGTIVTYEIVLVQFNALNEVIDDDDNVVCPTPKPA